MAVDNLRPVFRRGSGDITANYDFFDVTSSTGYKRFYCASFNEGNSLIPEAIPSNDSLTQLSSSTGNTELNFDYEFARPMVVKGLLFWTGCAQIQGAGTTASTVYWKVRVLKVNLAAAESEIAAQLTTDTLSCSSGTTANASLRTTLQFSCPLTRFKAGEKLRMEVIMYYTYGSGSVTQYFYYEPSKTITLQPDRNTGGTNTPEMYILVPFRVAL